MLLQQLLQFCFLKIKGETQKSTWFSCSRRGFCRRDGTEHSRVCRYSCHETAQAVCSRLWEETHTRTVTVWASRAAKHVCPSEKTSTLLWVLWTSVFLPPPNSQHHCWECTSVSVTLKMDLHLRIRFYGIFMKFKSSTESKSLWILYWILMKCTFQHLQASKVGLCIGKNLAIQNQWILKFYCWYLRH